MHPFKRYLSAIAFFMVQRVYKKKQITVDKNSTVTYSKSYIGEEINLFIRKTDIVLYCLRFHDYHQQ